MHVVATAGHVDHGKSTLVRALTGMEPDRWAEERRRGMTIDLGFAWTALPGGSTVAFVDVPGHERFVTNMLAGVGPVPAAMLVVAADEGWMPQSAEHLDALHALGVRHGLLVITRSDLRDPAPARAAALAQLAGTSLDALPSVCVSGRTGAGLDGLRAELAALVERLPAPDTEADVRLWVDRAFTVRGAGTVVTGTLPAGRIRLDDELELGPGGRRVRVRGLQSLGAARDEVGAVARVAVNLRGVPLAEVGRGAVLLAPGRWLPADVLDVRLGAPPGGAVGAVGALPRQLSLHVGAAAVTARVRQLGADTARLALRSPLPLRIGDRAVLRDPGRRQVVAGVLVLDVRPPGFRRRGAAAARASELSTMDGVSDARRELARRGVVLAAELTAMGAAAAPGGAQPVGPDGGRPDDARPDSGWAVDGWVFDEAHADELAERLVAAVAEHAAAEPLSPGLPLRAAQQAIGLPDPALVPALLRRPAARELTVAGGRISRAAAALPAQLRAVLATLRTQLAENAFAAPSGQRLAELGLDRARLATLVRAGELLRLADGVYLLPGAEATALAKLAELPDPFTLSQARQALGTTRRVAVPLLELLARTGHTKRTPDGQHHLT